MKSSRTRDADGVAVWVTGATGFLGAAACAALHAAGYAVRPVVRRAADSEPGTQTPVVCDLLVSDLAAEARALARASMAPGVVVHLAAEIPAAFEGEEVDRLADRNRAMDENVFSFAASAGAAVVFASSASVYGEGRGHLFTEDGPTNPRGPYAEAKLRSEREGASAAQEAGAPFAALRIAAPYGPGQRTRTVVQHFLRRAMDGEPLGYHGTGSRMQDFVYVTDVADAIVGAVHTAAAGVFNVASGRAVTMRELAATVAEVVGGEVAVGPSGQPDAQEGATADYSIEAAASVLGWEPATPLRQGLERWREALVSSGRWP